MRRIALEYPARFFSFLGSPEKHRRLMLLQSPCWPPVTLGICIGQFRQKHLSARMLAAPENHIEITKLQNTTQIHDYDSTTHTADDRQIARNQRASRAHFALKFPQ